MWRYRGAVAYLVAALVCLFMGWGGFPYLFLSYRDSPLFYYVAWGTAWWLAAFGSLALSARALRRPPRSS